MAEHRRVRLDRKNRNQAVGIPVEFELLGDDAIMRLVQPIGAMLIVWCANVIKASLGQTVSGRPVRPEE
jgi:hypothetical protein